MWRKAVARTSTSASGEHQNICILGSTGSIGTQTLDIVRLFPDRLAVHALTARSNVDLLARQIEEFSPEVVAIGDAAAADELRRMIGRPDLRILVGADGYCEAAAGSDVDTVVASVVGFAGLPPVLAALEAGKKVALANKETLVVAGALVADTLARNGGMLLPVDSEHSAIFQCLVGESQQSVERLILTASGGPFRTRSARSFESITREEALDHPNWSMGAKITIDSATLMNKGLEVIEAHWMFGMATDQIDVLVHPQSVIHSMVVFQDGSTKAQLGVPDMKVPIQYALTFPDRWPAPHQRLDWSSISSLDFEPPDLERFPCLHLAYDALRRGGTAPAVLNAANEEAVSLFLQGRIRFVDIPGVIDDAVVTLARPTDAGLEELVEVDREARRLVADRATGRIGTHPTITD